MKKKIKISYIEGKKIYLRPFLKSDLTKKYLSWINNYQRTSFMEAGKFPLSEYDLKKYYENASQSKNAFLFAVCNKKHIHIGNALVSNIDWVNRRCTYGRLIGDAKNSLPGSGTELLKLIQDFAFYKLNMNLIWTTACNKNYASIKSNMKSGMKLGGSIKEFFFRDNKYYDVTFFYQTRKNFLQDQNK